MLPIGNCPSNKYFSPKEKCSADDDSFDNSVDDNGENICQCSDECNNFAGLENNPTTCHASRVANGTLNEDTEYHNVGDLHMLKCRFTTKEHGKKAEFVKS